MSKYFQNFLQVVSCANTVHAVAISSAAEQTLNNITEATGGQIFFVGAAADQSNILADSLRALGQLNTPVLQRIFTLLSEAYQLDAGATTTTDVIVDSTLGNSLTFSFDYTNDVIPQLTSPAGVTYDVTSSFVTSDSVLRSYVFAIPDNLAQVRII